ncbi:hypothetical protein KSAC_09860 [Komagataeibacter saccharivorans]|nr:hypothetical protein KSAC_09860 [Komagataeibacter saccharivorans]
MGFPLPASRFGDHHGMDVTTALEKPEDGDFSGGAPGSFVFTVSAEMALVDFDLFFRSIMSDNDFPKLR